MKAVRMAMRLLVRHWRSGELLVLALALVVGVAAMTAVGFFTDRVRLVLAQESGELLAADLVLSSRRDLDAGWRLQAERQGLQTARTVELRSVVLAKGQPQLVELKAVDGSYPLRGLLRVSDGRGAPDVATAGPGPGTVWVDPVLAGRLALAPGDSVQVGSGQFAVAQILEYEPDRAGSVFNIAPRLMMHRSDLPETGLIGTGTLKREGLLIAGEPASVAAYRAWLEPRISAAEQLLDGRNARPELATALERAEKFLGLAALVAVLLAGVAIAMAAHRHARRNFDSSAIMRCLGAEAGMVLRFYAGELLILGVVAAAVGCIAGFAAQEVLARLLSGLVHQALPLPGLQPLFFGMATGLVLLLGFALPAIAALRRVPPLRVLRRELSPDVAGRTTQAAALVAALLLCGWQAGDARLAAMVIGGALVTVLLLIMAAHGLIRLLAPLRARSGLSWRYGIAALSRRSGQTVVQMLAFGLGIMALLLLTLVRTDLIDGWQQQLPPGTPNTFLINVQPEQVAPVRAFLAEAGAGTPQFHPMVKGRLVAINDRAVAAGDYEDERARRLMQREFNLSWAAAMHGDNYLVEGAWWGDAPAMQWSVERGLAETLGIRTGDRLRYDIAGMALEGAVTSLREVSWDSFRVNFFVIAPPGYLPPEQASYISSFYLAPESRATGGALLQRFPTVTLIDVQEVMQRVRTIVARVALAVEFVFIFTLLAGLVVLLAAVQSSQDERMHEVAVLRTLGASGVLIRRTLIAEFGILGLLSGLLAAMAATAVAFILAEYLFHIAWAFNPLVWLMGLLVGGILIPLAGIGATRHVLKTPPMRVLRQQG